jgi:hypothetical protein
MTATYTDPYSPQTFGVKIIEREVDRYRHHPVAATLATAEDIWLLIRPHLSPAEDQRITLLIDAARGDRDVRRLREEIVSTDELVHSIHVEQHRGGDDHAETPVPGAVAAD